MAPSLLCAALAFAGIAHGALQLAFDATLPPLFTVRPSYLSVNLDTGSLFNAFPFDHAPFNTLVRNLVRAAPMNFRIGGGAADSTLFTGEGGASANCTVPGMSDINICVSAGDIDAILAFAQSTGVGLVWDLNAALRPDSASPWNASNAAALLEKFASAPLRGLPTPAAFQLGNEPEDWYKRNPPLNVSGPVLAADFHTLRKLLSAHPSLASAAIYGPSACCEDRYPLLAAFLGPVVGALDALDVHGYPIPRLHNNSCVPPAYLLKTAMQGVVTTINGYKALGAPILALGTPLILGETATSAHGGCDGLSNRFVAGFTFMLELGTLGELGVAQVNRQDIAGFSSQMGPSNYALLGPPGWHGAGVPLGQPHPDYWVALLWKQLVGTRVLSSALQADDGNTSQVDAHVWCSTSLGRAVITYFAMEVPEGTQLALPLGLPPAPRTEFILTSPAGLYADSVQLNGAVLEALETGELPAWPVPGKSVPEGGIVLPPFSFGFLMLDAADAPACL